MDALYAFNRITDDLGDDTSVPIELRKVRLKMWRESLRMALEEGKQSPIAVSPDTSEVGTFWTHPALAAITDMAQRHQIPSNYLFDVIDGVEMDLTPFSISTFSDLQKYCYHVAGAVGLCCIHVWGFHDQRAIPLAIDCGIALQLTNILRDLNEDYALGRTYLPDDELQKFAYSPDELGRQVRNPAFLALMKFEVERVKEYYSRAEQLFSYLSPSGRRILRAMIDIYRGLLIEIERRDFDVFSDRVSLPKWKKLWIAGRAMLFVR